MQHWVENKIFAKILAQLGNINQQQYMFTEAIQWYKKSFKFNDLDQKPKKNLNLCETKLLGIIDEGNLQDISGKLTILMYTIYST